MKVFGLYEKGRVKALQEQQKSPSQTSSKENVKYINIKQVVL